MPFSRKANFVAETLRERAAALSLDFVHFSSNKRTVETPYPPPGGRRIQQDGDRGQAGGDAELAVSPAPKRVGIEANPRNTFQALNVSSECSTGMFNPQWHF